MYELIYNNNFKTFLKKKLWLLNDISQLKICKNEQDMVDEQSTDLLKKLKKIN